MKAKRLVKPSKKQEGYGIKILFKDDKVEWFVVSANECNRVECSLENYEGDTVRFLEFDTVVGGVVLLNLKHVTAAHIERGLSKAAGGDRGDKYVTVHFAGGRGPEHITAADAEGINILANMLNNMDINDHRRFVFIETQGGDRKLFSVNDVTFFELP